MSEGTSNKRAIQDVRVGSLQGVVAVVTGRAVGPWAAFQGAGSSSVVSVRGRVVAKPYHVAAATVSQHVPAETQASHAQTDSILQSNLAGKLHKDVPGQALTLSMKSSLF